MQKRWVIKETPEEERVRELAESINVNPHLATLLYQRKISTYEQAEQFFCPALTQLHDPFLMLNMGRAVERLTQAIGDEEKIMIYGDYDVDGTTSVALVFGFLQHYSSHLIYYIPDRYDEGYGVSEQGIRYAAEAGVSLIITLDCGIKALNTIGLAGKLGVDVIVCDHHLPGEDLPPAYAVLDPKQADCPYPYKELSGCGVGFKLLHAWCLQNSIPEQELFAHLDLLAVSIAADIVPLTGENRVLSHFGLKVLARTKNTGLRALIQTASIKVPLSIRDVVFRIAPRINAAGRVSHGRNAVALLLTDDEEEAISMAKAINENNTSRKEFDSTITKEALELIESDVLLKGARSTVLFKHDWHKGVIGIVASRCIEKYHRPTIILTESNSMATGSARSIPGFDIYEAISSCSEYLEQYGGHTHAAGLTLKIENVEAFASRFEEVASNLVHEELLTPPMDIDLEIPLERISPKFFSILKRMAPFGPQNMVPVFASRGVSLASRPRIIKGKHLVLLLKRTDLPPIEAIAWNMAPLAPSLERGPFDLAYTIEENEYRGNKTLRLCVEDIQFHTNLTHT
ncbi:single-stranded-DNA-specific exonuclease RecJ [Roseivirga sp. BDSF3-8]|uniref:single-stranded-DNA-specific exonuclease RecJ n=1 Tax=Roseivirga sp. BDSF3-8 TaxID=3241598 RepID=UPI003531FCDC